jgi:hypothetical protein
MSIEILHLKTVDKGAVKYSFNVKITAWGMTIRDCCLMEKNDQSWISFPCRKYEKDGETKYADYIFFDKEVKARLVSAIKEELTKVLAKPSVNDEESLF